MQGVSSNPCILLGTRKGISRFKIRGVDGLYVGVFSLAKYFAEATPTTSKIDLGAVGSNYIASCFGYNYRIWVILNGKQP